MKVINNFIYFVLFKLIIFYQKIISPIIPARCRYYPTCSNYGRQALLWHGGLAGSWLLLKRIGRCHPLGGHGIDFVPLPLASYKYFFISNSNDVNKRSFKTYVGSNVYRDNTSYTVRLNQLMSRYQ